MATNTTEHPCALEIGQTSDNDAETVIANPCRLQATSFFHRKIFRMSSAIIPENPEQFLSLKTRRFEIGIPWILFPASRFEH